MTPVVAPAEDLDWQEFIERQETFLAAKNQRLEVMRSRAPPAEKPQVRRRAGRGGGMLGKKTTEGRVKSGWVGACEHHALAVCHSSAT